MAAKVYEVMTERPRCVTPQTLVTEAAQLMVSDDVGALPILAGEQLAGVITDRDIVVRAVAKGIDPCSVSVREVASSEVCHRPRRRRSFKRCRSHG
jgi:CBS domain-containing protein